MLWNSANPSQRTAVRYTQAAADRLGIELQSLEVQSVDELEPAFARATEEQADALLIPDHLFNLPTTQERILAFAEQGRLPTMHVGRGAVEAGALMTYTVSNSALLRGAADYVVRILSGARPAELPIEPPPVFELVINTRAADAIGFTFPASMLAKAATVLP
jgi:putative tryptophan/tyrosine transport system substrate-binding protein